MTRVGPISAVRQIFQMYRLGAEGPVWWRTVSPNGRVLARAVVAHDSIDGARASIELMRRRAADLEPSMRLTQQARWHWVLGLDGQPRVESLCDLDRRVRCDLAWRSFRELVPSAEIDPVVHRYRSTGLPAGVVALSRDPGDLVGRVRPLFITRGTRGRPVPVPSLREG